MQLHIPAQGLFTSAHLKYLGIKSPYDKTGRTLPVNRPLLVAPSTKQSAKGATGAAPVPPASQAARVETIKRLPPLVMAFGPGEGGYGGVGVGP